MPRYRTYGKLDDPHAVDGDMAFVKMITRLNPEQLGTGEVAYSQNGRMDNDRTWVPRKGVDVFNPPLTIGEVPILGNSSGATSTVLPFTLNDDAVNGVYGSVAYVDPSSGKYYIAIATNNQVMTIDMASPTVSAGVSYPASAVIDSAVDMIQALDQLVIFRDGQTAWKWDMDTADYAFDAVSTVATTVTVDDGTNNTVVADGVVTVTNNSHSRSTGNILSVYDPGTSGLVEGDKYEIVVNDSTGYKFYAEIADGTYSVTMGGKQPLGGGYVAMPNAPWGVYHENRLILPYNRSLTVGETKDEIIFSDIFDIETYDPISNQFRMGSGSGDEVVGISPLLDDRLLVFCRRSVHVITGVSGDLSNATRTEITREVGCIARKSIVEVGGSVLWLSDQGVYSMTYGQELNLIANSIPLSEPIENEIRSINWAYASNAVAAYVDNRYFLAVPFGLSRVNNTIFVYNFLNQGWESIDTYPDGFNIKNMLVVPYNGRNQLFLINDQGAVHQTDVNGGNDRYENSATESQVKNIDGQLLTRRYTFNTLDTKRFNRSKVLADAVNGGGELKIYAVTIDPDEEKLIEDTTITDGEDYTLKQRIARRGYGVQLKIETNSAKIRGDTVEAIVHQRDNADRN